MTGMHFVKFCKKLIFEKNFIFYVVKDVMNEYCMVIDNISVYSMLSMPVYSVPFMQHIF